MTDISFNNFYNEQAGPMANPTHRDARFEKRFKKILPQYKLWYGGNGILVNQASDIYTYINDLMLNMLLFTADIDADIDEVDIYEVARLTLSNIESNGKTYAKEKYYIDDRGVHCFLIRLNHKNTGKTDSYFLTYPKLVPHYQFEQKNIMGYIEFPFVRRFHWFGYQTLSRNERSGVNGYVLSNISHDVYEADYFNKCVAKGNKGYREFYMSNVLPAAAGNAAFPRARMDISKSDILKLLAKAGKLDDVDLSDEDIVNLL